MSGSSSHLTGLVRSLNISIFKSFPIRVLDCIVALEGHTFWLNNFPHYAVELAAALSVDFHEHCSQLGGLPRFLFQTS